MYSCVHEHIHAYTHTHTRIHIHLHVFPPKTEYVHGSKLLISIVNLLKLQLTSDIG